MLGLKSWRLAALIMSIASLLFAGAAVAHHTNFKTQSGIASLYWQDQMTANGERFNKHAMTAAHKTLPFGTYVKVTRVKTGKSVVVRINDRGPFIKGRIIDLSQAAAAKIGLTRKVGITKVNIEVVPKPQNT
ncbi:MAG: septal ring lytic transglycosylase RlpA family protein [Pseudomonadota bacterium]